MPGRAQSITTTWGCSFFASLMDSSPSPGFAHHFHVGLILQHAAEAAPHQAVIIHQQHCDLLFHKTPLSPSEYPDAPEFRLPLDAKR